MTAILVATFLKPGQEPRFDSNEQVFVINVPNSQRRVQIRMIPDVVAAFEVEEEKKV